LSFLVKFGIKYYFAINKNTDYFHQVDINIFTKPLHH
jgi:hypothetical protein